VADRPNDDQICRECGTKLAPEQRYCVSCGARRGLLPGAIAAAAAKEEAAATKGAGGSGAGGGKGSGGAAGSGGDDDGGRWRWMPSPPAIAIAVIGMLALGVGLGSAMSEIASSAPLSTILLEYPNHATSAPPAEEPEEEEFSESEPEVAEAPEEAPEIIEEAPLLVPEEVVEEPLLPEEATEEPELVPFNPEEGEEEGNFLEEEEPLPEVKHAFVIVLGESGYDETFGTQAPSPYLSRTLPKKGELLPNYYGVTSGVLANEIALLSGQGPTAETAANCPNPTAIAPGTVSVFAEQVEGTGCQYGKEVKTLPTELTEGEITWRAYVQDMEKGGDIGQPWRCRRPTLGSTDVALPTPEDTYVNWRNPVVYFAAIVEGDECEKHDVGFEILTKDLSAKKKTPTLSLIFPETAELKTLIPAIMASPAYAEGGLIMLTSAQAPQAGERIDQKACCLAPEFPNLPTVEGATVAPAPTTPAPTAGTSTTEAGAETEESTTATTATKYTEESVKETGGGGKVGLLMISSFVEPGKVEETEYANHFTLLKTLATMLGVEPMGYAAEEEVPTLSPELFIAAEEPAEEESTGPETPASKAAFRRLLRSIVAPPDPAARHRGTS
jgi:phosphatidylinositol-3-phosphatase